MHTPLHAIFPSFNVLFFITRRVLLIPCFLNPTKKITELSFWHIGLIDVQIQPMVTSCLFILEVLETYYAPNLKKKKRKTTELSLKKKIKLMKGNNISPCMTIEDTFGGARAFSSLRQPRMPAGMINYDVMPKTVNCIEWEIITLASPKYKC